MQSSQPSPDLIAARLMAAGEDLAGSPAAGFDPVSGGANSRIYKLTCASGDTFALKSYPEPRGDPRDRLATEVTALEFLARHGVGQIPEVAAVSAAKRIVLFNWIAGRAPAEITLADIDDAVEFLGRLQSLDAAGGAEELPLASEACLSGREIVDQIEGRLAALRDVGADEKKLADFLGRRLTPALAEIAAWAEDGLAGLEIDFGAEIGPTERTLSPSDFGFHNALKTTDGGLIYVDFEYFGHDDPVKLTADFLLHPAMRLSAADKAGFTEGIAEKFKDYRDFLTRLQHLMPLYGLRWCMIMLNEFLPASWARRLHAGAAGTRDQAKARQLEKAENLMAWVHENYRDLSDGFRSGG